MIAENFILGAPSMVYGKDLIHNVEILSGQVKDIEIVLFQTPELHNLPTLREIDRLRELGEREGISYTVHLPASLEPAAEKEALRRESLETAAKIINLFSGLRPRHFILHLPFTKPTLVAETGCYFAWESTREWNEWAHRADEALKKLADLTGTAESLLVENINYSPRFLEPFWKKGRCRLCLDLGHLLLGRESVAGILRQYLPATRVIHLHGVDGFTEHISLASLPPQQLADWFRVLRRAAYQGVITLEVFDPRHLEESLNIAQAFCQSGAEPFQSR